MIYLDTNVLLYATLTHVDTQTQQDKAIKILTECIENNSLVLSNLNLLEYAFVMKKANEENGKIKSALELFQVFVKNEKIDFCTALVKTLENDYTFKNSFDVYHVVFAHTYECNTLITFDKGFKKFKNIYSMNIDIS